MLVNCYRFKLYKKSEQVCIKQMTELLQMQCATQGKTP